MKTFSTLKDERCYLGYHIYSTPPGVPQMPDLYYCSKDRDDVLLLVRYGDDSQDRVQGSVSYVRRLTHLTPGIYTPALIEALRRYDAKRRTSDAPTP